MKKLILLLLVFISSCSTDMPVTVIITPDTSPMWRQFGFDARHTGNPNSPKVSIPPVMNGTVEWCDTVTTSSVYDGTNCAVDSKGNIYFLSTPDNSLAQIIKYNSSGHRIWGRDTLYSGALCGIAISSDESRIYYSDFTHINCRDSSGNLLWRINERGVGTPAIDKENNIYINNNSLLSKISPEGTKLWSLAGIDNYIFSPALDRENNIYIPAIKNGHNVLLKVNKFGSTIWTYDFNNYTPNTSFSVVIDGYGNIYYSHDKLYCLSIDGRLKWQNSFGSDVTPAITNDNKIIVKSYSGFSMLDTSGTVMWSDTLNVDNNQSYIVLDDYDNMYFNHWTNNFSVISLDKFGNIRWNLQNITNGLVIPGPALSPLARLITFPKRPARVYCLK